MRKLFILTLIVLSLIPYIVFGQLKRQDKSVEIKQEITKPFDNQFMGLAFLIRPDLVCLIVSLCPIFQWAAKVSLRAFI